MAKITIYVPDELKTDMDAADAMEPNWSAVAQEAFRVECGRLSNRKRSSGKMNQAIERLRLSKEKFANDEKVRGNAAGRDWAMNRAEYPELERLAAWEPEVITDYPWETYANIVDDERPDASDTTDFWKAVAGTETPSDAFVEAFTEGALEVYGDVQDKL